MILAFSAMEIFNCANTKHMFFTIIFHKQSTQSDYWLKRISLLGCISFTSIVSRWSFRDMKFDNDYHIAHFHGPVDGDDAINLNIHRN